LEEILSFIDADGPARAADFLSELERQMFESES
jgi:hypothetical protein